MGFDVKNTTISGFLELICPHYCIKCGEIGGIICDRCKKDNTNVGLCRCLKCGAVGKNRCRTCALPFKKGWMVGYRDELVGEMVSKYKYEPVRALARPLAEMMGASLPETLEKVVIVPLPTISKHIRQRGFDHTGLLAKQLARRRGWKVRKLIRRAEDSVQVGASEKQRKEQAARAYTIRGNVSPEECYLVIDDVWTTGASMESACRLLKKAGAKNIIVAVLARNRIQEKIF